MKNSKFKKKKKKQPLTKTKNLLLCKKLLNIEFSR